MDEIYGKVFHQEKDTEMADKHLTLKRCSMLLAIGEEKIKTIVT